MLRNMFYLFLILFLSLMPLQPLLILYKRLDYTILDLIRNLLFMVLMFLTIKALLIGIWLLQIGMPVMYISRPQNLLLM